MKYYSDRVTTGLHVRALGYLPNRMLARYTDHHMCMQCSSVHREAVNTTLQCDADQDPSHCYKRHALKELFIFQLPYCL